MAFLSAYGNSHSNQVRYVILIVSCLCLSGLFWSQYLSWFGLTNTAPSAEATPGTITISGILVNSKTERPLPVTEIRLKHQPGGVFPGTDSTGAFRLTEVRRPPGGKVELILRFPEGQVRSELIDLQTQADFVPQTNGYGLGVRAVYPPRGMEAPETADDHTFAVVQTQTGGLFLRETHSRNGTVLGKLPKGARVEVVFRSGVFNTINGKKGEWVIVRGQEREGYVFDGYLAYEP